MAQTAGSVVVEVGANTSNFDRAMSRLHMGLGRLDRSADRANRSLGRVSRGAASATLSFLGLRGAVLAASGGFLGGAGLVYAMQKAVAVAINVEEQINKVRVVFGASGKELINWSKSTATSIGLARVSALEAAGTFGNMLRPLGIIPKQAAVMSRSLVNLAGDMSSFNNASLEETLLAIRAGLAGEVEPLRRFGVFLSEVRLKAEAIRSGFVGPGFKGVLNPLVKSLSAYNLILKDTKLAQGDYNRTKNSTANIIRTVKAQITDLAGVFGSGLEPVVNRVGQALRDKLADPTTQDRIREIGRLVGEKLMDAFERLGQWFNRNWAGIQSGFQVAGQGLKVAADAAVALAAGLKQVADATPGGMATLLAGLVGLRIAAGMKGGKGGATGLAVAGLLAVPTPVKIGAGISQIPGAGGARNYSPSRYPALAELLAHPGLFARYQRQLVAMADGPTIATSSPEALQRMERFARRLGLGRKPGSLPGGDREGRRQAGAATAAANKRSNTPTGKPIRTDAPLQTVAGSGSKASSKVQELLPANLRLAVAAAEVTQGTRDDLRAWRRIEDWLEARIKVTRNVNRKIEMLEALAEARSNIASLKESGAAANSPDGIRSRMSTIFGGPFLGGEAFGIASSFGYKAKPRDLLRDLRMQNAQLTILSRSLTRLRKRGAPGALLEDIRAGGLENADEAAALAGASPKVLKQYIKAFKNRERLEERVQTMSVQTQTVNINATNVTVGGSGNPAHRPATSSKTSRRVGQRRGGR